MKLKFNLLTFVLLVSSLMFINYNLTRVGVPDALVLCISIAYCILFPWRTFTVIEEKGNERNETDK